jgi:Sec-independent protein translocase protein TatA
VSFGTEILFILLLALLVLGPKRLQTTLAQIARAKAQFENATHSFKSQLAAELAEAPPKVTSDGSHELVEALRSHREAGHESIISDMLD